MNKLPNFICVGAQKAGTTTLHDILKQHPDIYLPDIKETKFFRDLEKFNKGISYYQNTYFKDVNQEKIIGEIDPEYIYFQDIPKRILNTLGKDIKLIFILRNPASRAFSHYLMNKRRGIESLEFLDAINIEISRLEKDRFSENHFSYLSRGYYFKQINTFLQYFPIENMLFLRFEEDLLKNQNLTLSKIYNFLNIDEYEITSTVKSNPATSAKYPIINSFLFQKSILKRILRYMIPIPELRKKIANKVYKKNIKLTQKESLSYIQQKSLIKKYFLQDIKDLENMTKLNLSSWYKDLNEKK